MRILLLAPIALILTFAPATAVHADGNLTAVVQNGLLVIRGDNADNQLRITTDGAPAGGVTLIPRNSTTINGAVVPFLDVPNIPRGVSARFGGGEDAFGGTELEAFPGDMIVDMGGEADIVAFTDLVADRCEFNFGTGNDNAGLDSVSCATMRLRGGGGDDRMNWAGGGIAGETSVGMGAGPDGLEIENVAFGGPVRISMSGGDDLLKVLFGTAFAGSAYLSGGAGTANAFVDDGSTSFAVPPTIIRFQQ